MGGLLHLAPPSPLLAVPYVTAHPSTASIPTSYYLMWHYNCLWIKPPYIFAARLLHRIGQCAIDAESCLRSEMCVHKDAIDQTVAAGISPRLTSATR